MTAKWRRNFSFFLIALLITDNSKRIKQFYAALKLTRLVTNKCMHVEALVIFRKCCSRDSVERTVVALEFRQRSNDVHNVVLNSSCSFWSIEVNIEGNNIGEFIWETDFSRYAQYFFINLISMIVILF